MEMLGRVIAGAFIGGVVLHIALLSIVVMVALSFCSAVKAGETWAVVSCCSYHFDSAAPRDYEQLNLGLGVEHGTKALRVLGGVYRNSERADSVYFGGSATAPVGPVKLGAALVIVSGYERSGPEPVKGLVLVGAWEGRRIGVNLLYIPKDGEDVAVIALQFKFRFGMD